MSVTSRHPRPSHPGHLYPAINQIRNNKTKPKNCNTHNLINTASKNCNSGLTLSINQYLEALFAEVTVYNLNIFPCFCGSVCARRLLLFLSLAHYIHPARAHTHTKRSGGRHPIISPHPHTHTHTSVTPPPLCIVTLQRTDHNSQLTPPSATVSSPFLHAPPHLHPLP